jgi:hypothetical protein
MKLSNFIQNHFWKNAVFPKIHAIDAVAIRKTVAPSNDYRASRRVALAGNESVWTF